MPPTSDDSKSGLEPGFGAFADLHRPGAYHAARVRRRFRTFRPKESVMQITIQGHTVEVTPALRDYCTNKFERITRHFDHLHELSIVLGIEKVLHKAEATIKFSGKKTARTLHANATATDMYAAIDVLVDKIDKQVLKHKEKLTDHHAETVRATRYG
jgi:ribosome hibernation promoting factor